MEMAAQIQGVMEIRYLVPLQCYEMLQNITNDSLEKKYLQQIKNNSRKIEIEYIDPYLLDYKFHLLKELETSFKLRPISEIYVCPKIIKYCAWKILTTQQWYQLNKKNNGFISKIPILYCQNEQLTQLLQSVVYISAVFQNEKCSKAFCGYIPAITPLVTFITIIGNQLGFSGFETLSFSALNSQTYLNYQTTSIMRAQDFKETPFIVSNLLQQNQNTSSMIAERSGHANWQQFLQAPNSQQQMSVSTATDIALDQDRLDRRQHRIRIFKPKEKEEIEKLKQRSLQVINGKKIMMPQQSIQKMEQNLDELANQSLKMLTL